MYFKNVKEKAETQVLLAISVGTLEADNLV